MIIGKNFQGAGNTKNQDSELRNKGTQRFSSYEQADGYPLGWPQYFLVCQTMAKICILWDYFDMIRNPSPNTLLRLIKQYNYSTIVNKGCDSYKGAFRVNKKNADVQMRTNSIILQSFWQDLL